MSAWALSQPARHLHIRGRIMASQDLPGHLEYLRSLTVKLRCGSCTSQQAADLLETAAKELASLLPMDSGSDLDSAEGTLAEGQELYRSMSESTEEAVSVVDERGVFHFMNTIGAQRLGGKPADFIGKSQWDVFEAQIANRHVAAINRIIETQKAQTVESVETIQGQKRQYRTSIVPLRESVNEPHRALVFARDITELRLAEERLRASEERHRMLCQNVPGMVYHGLPDWSSEIVANSERICGYSTDEFNSEQGDIVRSCG